MVGPPGGGVPSGSRSSETGRLLEEGVSSRVPGTHLSWTGDKAVACGDENPYTASSLSGAVTIRNPSPDHVKRELLELLRSMPSPVSGGPGSARCRAWREGGWQSSCRLPGPPSSHQRAQH